MPTRPSHSQDEKSEDKSDEICKESKVSNTPRFAVRSLVEARDAAEEIDQPPRQFQGHCLGELSHEMCCLVVGLLLHIAKVQTPNAASLGILVHETSV